MPQRALLGPPGQPALGQSQPLALNAGAALLQAAGVNWLLASQRTLIRIPNGPKIWELWSKYWICPKYALLGSDFRL